MHRRRSIRLQDYDYSQNGAYFVTMCAHNRMRLFGDVVDDEMVLNDRGLVVQEEWEKTGVLRPTIELDAFVIMPNHVHGIVVIIGDDDIQSARAQCIAPLPNRGATPNNVRPHSLGAIVRGFKGAATRRVNRLYGPVQHPIWQRNYYEHIIRSEASLSDLRTYIATNPARWAQDELFM